MSDSQPRSTHHIHPPLFLFLVELSVLWKINQFGSAAGNHLPGRGTHRPLKSRRVTAPFHPAHKLLLPAWAPHAVAACEGTQLLLLIAASSSCSSMSLGLFASYPGIMLSLLSILVKTLLSGAPCLPKRFISAPQVCPHTIS